MCIFHVMCRYNESSKEINFAGFPFGFEPVDIPGKLQHSCMHVCFSRLARPHAEMWPDAETCRTMQQDISCCVWLCTGTVPGYPFVVSVNVQEQRWPWLMQWIKAGRFLDRLSTALTVQVRT